MAMSHDYGEWLTEPSAHLAYSCPALGGLPASAEIRNCGFASGGGEGCPLVGGCLAGGEDMSGNARGSSRKSLFL